MEIEHTSIAMAFFLGFVPHLAWTKFRAEREEPHQEKSQVEHLDDVYEAHWDGLYRGHHMTKAGTFDRRELDDICAGYLVERGLDVPQAALTAIDELGI